MRVKLYEKISKLSSPKYYFLLILAITTILLPLALNPFQVHVLVLVYIYAILAESWNIIGGYSGQGSFLNAAFFGIAAYASSLLFILYGISPWIGMFVGAFLSVLLAIGAGYLCFRFGLKGHFFFLASIGITVAIQRAFINWYWPVNGDLIGGAYGVWVPVIKGDSLYHFQFRGKAPYYYIALAILLAELYITYKIQNSKLGYYFTAIRDDEDAAESLGIDTLKYKIVAFAISAALTAPAGTFYAQYFLFIDPFTVLTDMLSIEMVIVAVIGGMGTIFGPVIGAMILRPIMEYVRAFLGARSGLDLIITGLIIIFIATLRPRGFIKWFEDGYNYIAGHLPTIHVGGEKERAHSGS